MKPLIDYFYREDGQCPEGAFYELSEVDEDDLDDERALYIHMTSHHLPFLALLLGKLEAGGGKASGLSVNFSSGETMSANAWINGQAPEFDGVRAEITVDRSALVGETEERIQRAIGVLSGRK